MANAKEIPRSCGSRLKIRCIPDIDKPYRQWECTLFTFADIECGTANIDTGAGTIRFKESGV